MVILGVDEVGLGPLAGPIVVGAVIFGENGGDWVEKLTDSKKLMPKKREEYAKIIHERAFVGLGWVSATEMNKIGFSEALGLAYFRAVENAAKTGAKFDEIIMDGNRNHLSGTKYEKIVSVLPKADTIVKEVSAASIVAKVARDNYMVEISDRYPEYKFEKNMGYGTKIHREALEKYGKTPEHRTGYQPVKNTEKTAKERGDMGESKVVEFLESEGHDILARNYRKKFCEIDIISQKDEKIYFTEVKYRRDTMRGTPFEMINAQKQQRMRFATEVFFKSEPSFQDFQPELAVASVAGENFDFEDWFVIDEDGGEL